MYSLGILRYVRYLTFGHWVSLYFRRLDTTHKSILTLNIDLSQLSSPHILYTYITILIIVLGLTPIIYSQLKFMQTRNQTIINVLLLQIFFTLVITLFSGINVEESLLMASMPLTFIISFGSYHLKNRWLANFLLVCFIFALIFIQWIYMQ